MHGRENRDWHRTRKREKVGPKTWGEKHQIEGDEDPKGSKGEKRKRNTKEGKKLL